MIAEVRCWPAEPLHLPHTYPSYITNDVLGWLISRLRSHDIDEQEHALWAIRNLLVAEEEASGEGRSVRLRLVETGALTPLRDLLRLAETREVRLLVIENLECIASVLTPGSRRAILGCMGSQSPASSPHSRDSLSPRLPEFDLAQRRHSSPPSWPPGHGQQSPPWQQPRSAFDRDKSRDDSNVEGVVYGSWAPGARHARDDTQPLFARGRTVQGATLVLDAAAKADSANGLINHPPILTLPVST